MHAAQVQSWPEGPRYVSVEAPPPPTADEMQLRVLAAGAHNVVRSRASGSHYSAQTLPHTVGVDCVARDEATGQLYYVLSMADTFGTFAEYINVPRLPSGGGGGDSVLLVPLPADAEADPAAVAAAVNPAMSSWMAITARTHDRPADWTCLILGATSASGRLAVHAARALGASRVVGAGRSGETLRTVAGLDDHVVIMDSNSDSNDDDTTSQKLNAVGADVVLDYVYGEVAERYLRRLRTRKPVQYVQVGVLSRQPDIALPAALLRSTDVTVRGAGAGSWSLAQLAAELPALLPRLVGWPAVVPTTRVDLREIESTWGDGSLEGRVVYVI